MGKGFQGGRVPLNKGAVQTGAGSDYTQKAEQAVLLTGDEVRRVFGLNQVGLPVFFQGVFLHRVVNDKAVGHAKDDDKEKQGEPDAQGLAQGDGGRLVHGVQLS